MIPSDNRVSDNRATGPLITIAIPTYNRAVWLRGCVESALAQTYPNFEVLVSDNASTDETPEVLKAFDDPRLRVVRQEKNIGLMPNWNACLWEAKGDYIVYLPDDDRLAPWMLERCVRQIMSEPRSVMVVALNDLNLAAEGRLLPPARSRTLQTGVHDGAAIFLEYLKGRLSVQLCTLMLRTVLLRQYGGFPNDWAYAGDTAIWGAILLTGRAGFVNESCGAFAWHDESATSRYSFGDRLDSNRRFIAVIDGAADADLADPRVRREVKRQARRYIARDLIGAMVAYRKGGATLSDVLPLIWQARRDLFSGLGVGELRTLARPAAIILLPDAVSGAVAKLRQRLRTKAPRASGTYRSTNA
jgi:glycosyltransferase involved in cell wall biosynthesis